MSKEITKISPEGLDIANAYLNYGSMDLVCQELGVSKDKVSTMLQKREVKRYIDSVYLDSGYRNRNKLGELLDEIIESKLEEARETEMYSKKDLLDILAFAHKLRVDELKYQQEQEKRAPIKSQTNVQINEGSFGSSNYGKLLESILQGEVVNGN